MASSFFQLVGPLPLYAPQPKKPKTAPIDNENQRNPTSAAQDMASSFFQLVGPLALYAPQPEKPKTAPIDNENLLPVKPPQGYTENHSPTFLSTGNPCLDFFFHVVPDTPSETLTNWLEKAWKHNEVTTLKLICNLRGVQGTGKSDKKRFFAAALWLQKNHPKTLACNVKSIVELFGEFEDLPKLIYKVVEESDHGQNAPPEDRWNRNRSPLQPTRGSMKKVKGQKKKKKTVKKNHSKEEEIAMAKNVIERYSRDPDFRFLHDQISQFFADKLVLDMKYLNSGEIGKISLASSSKGCPFVDSYFDKATLLCESIARRVFPRESYPEYEGIEEAAYAYRVRDRLRKDVLDRLREALELPEIYIKSNKWASVPYSHVSPTAMLYHKKHFLKYDGNRFKEFLSKVQHGEAKIADGSLFPHEIINHLDDDQEGGSQVAELLWKRMVDDLSTKGKFRNCIAVCDVSKKLSDTAREVSLALGLLLSELSEHPWKGSVITFGAKPQLHKIEGDDLRSKTQFIRDMESESKKDFENVFKVILKVAVAGNLSRENMIKRVFVFSDMEFGRDSARDDSSDSNSDNGSSESDMEFGKDSSLSRSNSEESTDYEVVKKKFESKGYTIPEIVFWNLRNSKATPVASDQKGVALVSGFSKNVMKLLLGEEDIVAPGPEAVMELALSGPEYNELIVFD